jgi:hypothetical protein
VFIADLPLVWTWELGMNSNYKSYEEWFDEFKRLAIAEDLAWLVSSEGESHKNAFEQGDSPAEELDMAEWRGCGCGGGS